jgi:predicted enzyme related to lactoylglutathione lyase
MIIGTHTLLFSKDAVADRAFVRDILGIAHVDAGQGWLIFALPPSELGIHPDNGEQQHLGLYLMCDDVEAEVASLKSRGVQFSRPIENEGWGLVTTLVLPSGASLGLYQPKHPLANTAR